jgi:hypothetical protein
MLTRDAARDISEVDMNRIRGADGKNWVSSSVVLHPSESKTFSNSPMSGPIKPESLSVWHAPTCAVEEDVAHQCINHRSSITTAATSPIGDPDNPALVRGNCHT